MDPQHSYGMEVGRNFIETYREQNPADEVIHLDLFQMNIPQLDGDVFSAWGKLGAGQTVQELSKQEQAKVVRLAELVDQYVAADKYVFVSPMWNFSFPPVLKAYIDAICVAGKTFKYTEQGPIGLLTDKKAIHIQASGGVYSAGPMADFEIGNRHLKQIMNFHGVPSFESLFVEGMAAMQDQADQIKAAAIEQAKEAAARF